MFEGQDKSISLGENEGQADAELKLSLYYYDSCPFCRMVNYEIAFLNIEVEKRNVLENPQHYQDLLAGGGRRTVPCLLIEKGEEKLWMYESRDIIAFLKSNYA